MTTRAGKTAAYWLYDSRGALLYVGIASDPRARWKQHSHDKPWWTDVHTKTIEWFDSIKEAREAELESIREDLPIHNRTGTLSAGGVIETLPIVNMMIAKKRLHLYVNKVATGGDPVIIGRHGRPLALLVSYHASRLAEAQ